MGTGTLGKTYPDGTVLFRQGEQGEHMYVILDGKVEIFTEKDGQELSLALRGQGEFLGEMALLTHELRSASARAVGPVQLLSLDKKNFLRRVQEDPTIALRLVEVLSSRIREMNEQVAVLNRALQNCIGTMLTPRE